nr:MAG TPA: hypothetical protein [Caudoviricetes sp.]
MFISSSRFFFTFSSPFIIFDKFHLILTAQSVNI